MNELEYHSVSSSNTIPFSSPVTDFTSKERHQVKVETRMNTPEHTQQSSPTTVGGTPFERTGNMLEDLGGDAQKLIQCIDDLRNLGIEDLGVSLPEICVVGDQSTGKSSLIEGISQIKVPRQAGACTRCPMEIKLSLDTSHPWKCDIYLHKTYMFDGSNTKMVGSTRGRPLGPWQSLQVPEDTHFATVNEAEKDRVPDILYWAQLATLNPGKSPNLYKIGNRETMDTKLQVKFSPNRVRMEISGPKLPNLTFCDFPGVINVAEAADEHHLVQLVRNLVKQKVRSVDCINLLALSMTGDAANSNAMGIIEEVGAQQRTLVVLTKPDRVQAGESFDQWDSILSGNRNKFGFGYVVKNNPDPKVEHATARVQEAEFFENTPPYSTDLVQYTDRFGTENLMKALSIRLTEQIKNSLPEIIRKITQQALSVDAQLSRLPEPPTGNLPRIVSSQIKNLSNDVRIHVTGGTPDKPFQKQWNELVVKFRKTLADSRPVLVLPKASEMIKESIHIDSDSDVDDPPDNIHSLGRDTTKKNRHSESPNSPITPRKQRPVPNVPISTGFAKRFELAELRDLIDSGQKCLPSLVDPLVSERMSKISMQHWESLTTEFLESTVRMCESLVAARCDKACAPWQRTAMYTRVRRICEAYLSCIVEEQKLAVRRSLAVELYKASTYDEEGFTKSKEKVLVALKEARHLNRAKIYVMEQEQSTGKSVNAQVRAERAGRINEMRLGPDPYDKEIDLMATVRAYYDRAFSRFVDNVALGIQFELFGKLQDGLEGWLTRELGLEDIDAHERCESLLAIEPAILAQRDRLVKKRKQCLEARKTLDDLRRPFGSIGDQPMSGT